MRHCLEFVWHFWWGRGWSGGKISASTAHGRCAQWTGGVGAILVIRGVTRLREDAALGIVLSVFFGTGVVLLSVIQQLPTGNAAGWKRTSMARPLRCWKSMPTDWHDCNCLCVPWWFDVQGAGAALL